MEKSITIGDFLKMPEAHVIAIDNQNIGHTAAIEDVSEDNIHFVGVDEIVTFTFAESEIEYQFVFSTSELIQVHIDNFLGTPYCEHLYWLTTIGGERLEVELGFIKRLYKESTQQLINTPK